MSDVFVISDDDDIGESNEKSRKKSPNRELVRKRIKPTKISDQVTCSKITENSLDVEEKEEEEKTILNLEFTSLLNACRRADPSNDMELLINKKLLRYYETVHPDFVNSKSFCKTVQSVTNDINSNPQLVYLKITGIIDELRIRRKSKNIVVTNEEITTTGCEIKDRQIKRLNKALYFLKRKIGELENSEVDFDEDTNSTYLQEQRYKRRACEIYEKICDITGESKHAHRSVRKPISFQGTIYPQFNKAIQTFVNHTNTFPDYFDVIKCLQYCNKQYEFKLSNDDMKKIAQDAFIKIGKSLQNRRRADLYETVSYFVGTNKDPAMEDPTLLGKLSENKKFHSRIGAIIDKFADEQDVEKIPINNEATNDEKDTNKNVIENQTILMDLNDHDKEITSNELVKLSDDSNSNNFGQESVSTIKEINDDSEKNNKIPIVILDDDLI